MADFFVLGLIPGTNLQITFFIWSLTSSSLVLLVAARVCRRTHIIRNAIISLRLLRLVRAEVELPRYVA